jgi:hypothetical protein
MYLAESSLTAAEYYGHIQQECQQKAARIYVQRGQDALLAVASIDQLPEPGPRRARRQRHDVPRRHSSET